MRLLSTLKLNAFVLDEVYSSGGTVLTNTFKAALQQSFRFHSIAKDAFDNKNLN
jgi:hypothetical protein